MAPVVKNQIKNFTPYSVFADNKEILEAFGDTVANFSPVSINIVDYWNKSIETHDTFVWDPKKQVDQMPAEAKPFGFRKGPFYGFRNANIVQNPPAMDCDYIHDVKVPLPTGFPTKDGDGMFLGTGRHNPLPGHNTKANGDCIDNDNRYFINPLIGLQDKMAYTYLNNFYTVTEKAKTDPVLRNRLMNIADNNPKIDSTKFFSNTNALFTEEKTIASKAFITKKGTELGIRYAQRSAFDADLQGPMSNFSMKIRSRNAFEYAIESNILAEIFEIFVKPLAHPIGMTYGYKSICAVQDNDVDHPLIRYTYDSPLIEVNCLCTEHNKPGGPVKPNDPTGPQNPDVIVKKCGGIHQPKPAIIALSAKDVIYKDVPDPDNPGKTKPVPWKMPGLWDKISQDGFGIPDQNGDLKFNILSDYEHGYGFYKGDLLAYKKYILENGNYLIAWTEQGKVHDEAPKVTVEYHRVDYNSNTGYSLIHTFHNGIHCNVADNLHSTRVHQITETFAVGCVPSLNGKFIMDVDPKDPKDPNAQDHETLKPYTKPDDLGEVTDDQGNVTRALKYRGFLTTGSKPHGGKLEGWKFTVKKP